ncbi:MAG: DUF455 family protein, partial [Planctomycetota bacterium]|nr:DUF455 family protein [Planctomycetota bacterium]
MSAHLNDYCLRILASPHLSAKLEAPPSDLVDSLGPNLQDSAGKLICPARPSNLQFCDDKKKRHLFPRKRALKHKEGRARALHFFANHELLAIEVIARALLLFPDAPKAWRASQVETLAEEQIHLQLYIDRIQELGVDFGDLPVNDYIWARALDTQSKEQFVAFFALALEGANLDHSFEYMNLFDELGDEKSAAVMRRIFADEIIHTRRGIEWFDRWRDPDDFFTSFEKHLVW